jgi:hypothetical protein
MPMINAYARHQGNIISGQWSGPSLQRVFCVIIWRCHVTFFSFSRHHLIFFCRKTMVATQYAWVIQNQSIVKPGRGGGGIGVDAICFITPTLLFFFSFLLSYPTICCLTQLLVVLLNYLLSYSATCCLTLLLSYPATCCLTQLLVALLSYLLSSWSYLLSYPATCRLTQLPVVLPSHLLSYSVRWLQLTVVRGHCIYLLLLSC